MTYQVLGILVITGGIIGLLFREPITNYRTDIYRKLTKNSDEDKFKEAEMLYRISIILGFSIMIIFGLWLLIKY
jgi:uncharacterized membrane protein